MGLNRRRHISATETLFHAHECVRELVNISNERSVNDLSFEIWPNSLILTWAPPRPFEKGSQPSPMTQFQDLFVYLLYSVVYTCTGSPVHRGEYTEGGLENSNKFLRFYRTHLARKVHQTANLNDCLSRLWLNSDPKIRDAAPKPKCSKCHETGHHTVSCPSKNLPEVIYSAATIDEYFLSLLLK